MTYREWVDSLGFPSVKELLGLPESTLRMWYSFDRFPRTHHVVLILDKSKGLVSVEKWVREHARFHEAKKEAA